MSTASFAGPRLPLTNGLSKSGSEYRFDLNIFQTSSFIDNNGVDRALGEGESFSERDIDLSYRFGLADGLNILLGGKFRQVVAIDQVGSEEQDLGSSGLHSLYSHLNYTFDRAGKWEWAVLSGFGTTLFSELEGNDINTQVALGDSGFFYHLGTGFTYFLTDENFISSRILYRAPAANLSKEIYYQSELALLWPKFALFGGIEGVASMGNDGYSPSAKPPIGVALTNRYNSINRSFTEFYGGLGFSFSKSFRSELKYSSTAVLSRYDAGSTILFSLAYLNDGGTSKSERSKRKVKKEFKTYRVQAEVTKVAPKGKYFLIDKGLSDDVTRGMVFHIFINDYIGSSKLVAIGRAVKVQANKAVIKVLKRYKKRKVKSGYVARGGQIR